MILLILGIILFVGLVVVHEYGHYKAARKSGVEVEEFGIGFPPRIWGKYLKSGMMFSVNALPLGGFVKLKGEYDSDTEPGSYGAARLKNKVKILLAGVAMNLVTALGILTILSLVGMPQLFENQFNVTSDSKLVRQDVLIGQIETGSPAELAGLMKSDKIISIKNSKNETININKAQDFPAQTAELAGQKVSITVERNKQVAIFDVTLRSEEDVRASRQTDSPKGYLGVSPTEYVVRRATWSAPINAVGTASQFTWLTLKGIGSAIASVFQGNGGDAAQQVAGPVGIFVLIKDGSFLGFSFVLMIIAVISLTLAIVNALPIPALDGGKLFVTLFFRAIKKPLNKNTEELIHGFGFLLLMGLFILITIVDIKRIL